MKLLHSCRFSPRACLAFVMILVGLANILLVEQKSIRRVLVLLADLSEEQDKQPEQGGNDYNNPVAVRTHWRRQFRQRVLKRPDGDHKQRHRNFMEIMHNTAHRPQFWGKKNTKIDGDRGEAYSDYRTEENESRTKEISHDRSRIQRSQPKMKDFSKERKGRPPGMTIIQGEKPSPMTKPVFTEDPMAVLNYADTRIPGYINVYGNTTMALYGHVMRELNQRICARQIAQSNVLVVSPEAPTVVQMLQTTDTANETEGSLRRRINHAVGGCTLIHAHRQGHAYHGLNNTTVVDDWWRGFDNNPTARPGWILLGMWDHGWQNDQVMKQSLTLLKESTVTYIVLGFGANPGGSVYGQDAIQELIRLKYKVQMLSVSHLPVTFGYRALLRPNADITKDTIQTMFHGIQTLASGTGTPVLGYVFATQGLDMAIPSALAYEPTITATGIRYKKCESTMLKLRFTSTPSNQQVEQVDKRRKGFFRRNQGHHHQEQETSPPHQQQKGQHELLSVSCHKKELDLSKVEIDIWHSGETLETSEAVCVKTWCLTGEKSACTTRVLPKTHLGGSSSTTQTRTERNRKLERHSQEVIKRRPNLLLLLIDPISRARFERSLVKTNRLLQLLDFTSFSQYTAVGNNSGPNQAALYSGRPLASRDSIASHSQKNTTGQWLWDTLQDYGYATFKSEDGCIENSNMIQSLRPKVDHGDALLQLMCYDFQRPNCVGGTPAANHLLNYATNFIQAYEKRTHWAALLHFIDSHEDTQTLEGTLDDPLWHFIFSIYETGKCNRLNESHKESIPCTVWENTMIVIMSDHGLHYGGYLLSPQGLKERSQPLLQMHLPKSLSWASEALKANQNLYATPFDVYETILNALIPEASTKPDIAVGSTLLQPLPLDRTSCNGTNGVPAFVCDHLNADLSINVLIPSPASVMSFYADIPRVNKKVTPLCGANTSNATLFAPSDIQCVCATNMRSWYNCSEHPWVDPRSKRGETFSMVDCAGERLFDIKVQRDPKVLSSLLEVGKKPTLEQRPNILFIEVDSVSFPYADRHLPRTREVLNGMRLHRDSDGFTCGKSETLCAAEFKSFSVVGPSSIPNQVAAFGGCVVTVDRDSCSQLENDQLHNRTICADASHPAYKMELVKRHQSGDRQEPSATFCRVDNKKRSPWIFDIAKAVGYVTLFAEEFCFEDSIYVPQGNIFPLDNVDILPHKFFCRATERKALKESFEHVLPLWKYEYTPTEGLPHCLDQLGGYERGRVALDHIETMFSSYADEPKFAYLNAIAAHLYDDFDKMARLSETYDIILSSFLKRMLAKPEMANTIVVLRSDHGLQAGPTIGDYSIQVEAFRPWTEIVVPKNLPGLSLDRLFDNQHHLATSFDLYKSLTKTLVGEDSSLMSETSSWSYHLWHETIPSTRTCKDANIPDAYCIFESQRSLSSPNLSTCNMAESNQALACPQYSDVFQREMSVTAGNAYYSHKIEARACPHDGAVSATVSPSIAEQWHKIDNVTKQYTGVASEDFYWHPLQTSMLSAFVTELSKSIMKTEKRALNVCQTGFEAGHMSSMFLTADSNVKLHVFDSMEEPLQQHILGLIEGQFGRSRVVVYRDGSCPSVTKTNDFICDFVHGASTSCPTDNIDLLERAPCGVLLTSAATSEKLQDDSVYAGVVSQWRRLYNDGCIKNARCFVDDASISRNGRQLMSFPSKFCIALTTGNCQKVGGAEAPMKTCDNAIAQTTKHFLIHRLCPAHFSPLPTGLQ